ncbi:hypothetical protein N8Z81_03950, partial [Akkermansiaceae bacterium]|nr:hypothetical protein [Akkermansiaceae bacterium]
MNTQGATRKKNTRLAILSLAALTSSFSASAQQPSYSFQSIHATGDIANRPQQILYFSQQNNSHHSPSNFITELRRAFGERGIHLKTSTQTQDLNESNLNLFDGVFFFGNHNSLGNEEQSAVLDFANQGGGIVGM